MAKQCCQLSVRVANRSNNCTAVGIGPDMRLLCVYSVGMRLVCKLLTSYPGLQAADWVEALK